MRSAPLPPITHGVCSSLTGLGFATSLMVTVIPLSDDIPGATSFTLLGHSAPAGYCLYCGGGQGPAPLSSAVR